MRATAPDDSPRGLGKSRLFSVKLKFSISTPVSRPTENDFPSMGIPCVAPCIGELARASAGRLHCLVWLPGGQSSVAQKRDVTTHAGPGVPHSPWPCWSAGQGGHDCGQRRLGLAVGDGECARVARTQMPKKWQFPAEASLSVDASSPFQLEQEQRDLESETR